MPSLIHDTFTLVTALLNAALSFWYCWVIKCSSLTGCFNNMLKWEEWTSSTVGSVFEDHSRSSWRYCLQKLPCVEKPRCASPPPLPESLSAAMCLVLPSPSQRNRRELSSPLFVSPDNALFPW